MPSKESLELAKLTEYQQDALLAVAVNCWDREWDVNENEVSKFVIHVELLRADLLDEAIREARVSETKACQQICDDYRKREYGPHGTEWVSCEEVEEISKEIGERLAQLREGKT